MKLSHALLNGLKDYGAAEIFGIPGDFALPFFREIEATGILPLYTLSHEPGLGFAADAAARFRSGLSVAAVTYGAGALNMVNPVAQAYAEKSPVVVISGAPGARERTLGLGLHHQVKHLDSQFAIYREITAAQTVLNDRATAPAEIARVLTVALELSRPVYIELPKDMVAVACERVAAYVPSPFDPEAATAAAAEIIARLVKAERPAALVCVEARRYGLERPIAELCRRLGIPTATTFMARGILAEAPTPLIGTYLGLAGEDAIRHTIEDADTLLALGVILCDTSFGVSEKLIDRRRMIHAFDREVRFAHHTYTNVPLAALVKAMLDLTEGRPTIVAARPAVSVPPPAAAIEPRPAYGVLPSEIATAVNTHFARHGVMPIAADMGDCLFTAMDMSYTELVAPAYYATMGPGVPMGLGLQIASGKRPLILVGDGAFQMTGWELGNARRLGLDPIVLLFNNTSWGMLKAFQDETRYNDLDDWRFADAAASLGGKGRRVATPAELGEALEAAQAERGTWHLIEIMIPRGAFSRTLSRFTSTIKARSNQ